MQEKKSHSEDRQVIEILRSFLNSMLVQYPTDQGAPHEFWHPGELVPLSYPNVHLEKSPRGSVEAMFPMPSQEVLPDGEAWTDHLSKIDKHVSYLVAEGSAGYNARWIAQYRKKILATFLDDETKYMNSLLQVFYQKFEKDKLASVAGKKSKKAGLIEIMWVAFHTRSKNKVYHLADRKQIEMQPKTLTAFILLISDFVFSKGTMKTMDLLLARHFSGHPLLQRYWDVKDNADTLPGLNVDYTPLHDYPNTGWLNNDRLFIEQAFLHPQTILVDDFMILLGRGPGKSTYAKKMYLDRVTFMVSAQWLNIVNILGYRAIATPYLRKCFPFLNNQLTSYKLTEGDGSLSNLASFARALSQFLFGENSLFKLDDEDAKIWPRYCMLHFTKDLENNQFPVAQNWVKDPWMHVTLKDQKIPESHPLYEVRTNMFTMTNIVELLFFGKMWKDDGTSPVDYDQKPFYDDAEEKWADPFFSPLAYHFQPFTMAELGAELGSPETPDESVTDKEYLPEAAGKEAAKVTGKRKAVTGGGNA